MSNGTGAITASSGRPEILAPAGDEDCFLAALAAGADAVYLGLKQLSARMQAGNFRPEQLARLVELAHSRQRRVYVAINSLIKPGELALAWRMCRRLATQVRPDGLIVQDLAMLALARQTGFEGMLALSTLANVGSPASLAAAARFGASRVILPRELSLEEMRAMGAACPEGLALECFVHGALCYCVSGRCYWSSYMGGKSGLRGRCVQPCRRMYSRGPARQRAERLFSCQDLELAAVVPKLLSVPRLVSWKIEGRKKGPHYVYHAVTAYRLLRDNPEDRQASDMALQLLRTALGRPACKARFLPRKTRPPMAGSKYTGSGLLAGKTGITPAGAVFTRPRFDLLPRDYLRVGTEDERWHATISVRRAVPKGGAYILSLPKHKTPPLGTPVFLIDRREPELERLLREWRACLAEIPAKKLADISGAPVMPRRAAPRRRPDMLVRPHGAPAGQRGVSALWLTPRAQGASPDAVFWLPPDVWPENEADIRAAIDALWQRGARHFVLNSPWQRSWFTAALPGDADLIAGPFCNLANGLALQTLADAGFAAAFASPELSGKDFAALPGQSPLPLGVVLGGYWPVGVSRFGLCGVNAGEPFQSPLGEFFWSRNYGGTTWIYPAWPLDLKQKRRELLKLGYSFFAWLEETPPQGLPKAARPSLFNWELPLL